MSGRQLPALSGSSPPHTLSDTASSLVRRIPELLRRLRNLQNEEARLDARARVLVEQIPTAINRPPTPTCLIVSTPISKAHIRATVQGGVDRGNPSTPSHIDPRNIETPVKTFLLMESFALAMSVKSRRKGRIFLEGDSTEFGERRQN